MPFLRLIAAYRSSDSFISLLEYLLSTSWNTIAVDASAATIWAPRSDVPASVPSKPLQQCLILMNFSTEKHLGSQSLAHTSHISRATLQCTAERDARGNQSLPLTKVVIVLEEQMSDEQIGESAGVLPMLCDK